MLELGKVSSSAMLPHGSKLDWRPDLALIMGVYFLGICIFPLGFRYIISDLILCHCAIGTPKGIFRLYNTRKRSVFGIWFQSSWLTWLHRKNKLRIFSVYDLCATEVRKQTFVVFPLQHITLMQEAEIITANSSWCVYCHILGVASTGRVVKREEKSTTR